MVKLRNLKLPEFDKNCQVDEQKALVFDQKCRYDILLGAYFLTKTGIDVFIVLVLWNGSKMYCP